MAMDVFVIFTVSLLMLGAMAVTFGVDSRPGVGDRRRNV
jgi:hypothetical protein